MGRQDDSDRARLLRGALAGVIAGAAASFAMDRFQAAVTAMSSSGDDGGDNGGSEEPATEKAADRVADALSGHAVAEANKPLAGQFMHYALGIGLGVAYGIAAEFRPTVTAGFGGAFGIGTATVLDEGVVPAVGLGQAPWRAGWSSHLYSYASHLVFGGTAELVRRQVAGTLRA